MPNGSHVISLTNTVVCFPLYKISIFVLGVTKVPYLGVTKFPYLGVTFERVLWRSTEMGGATDTFQGFEKRPLGGATDTS